MKNSYKTLIVADPSLNVSDLNTTLKQVTETTGTTFEIYFANWYSEAISILKEEPPMDLVFLDLQLIQEPKIKMFSGKDLGMVIRELYPTTTIVVVNAPNDPVLIRTVSDSIKPEGFFVKNEMDRPDIVSLFIYILQGNPIYSSTALRCLVHLLDVSFKLDSRDVQLLRELDNGHTLKKIGELISLSQSAVSKRKRKLKLLFGVPDGNDRDLIKRALVLGFI